MYTVAIFVDMDFHGR